MPQNNMMMPARHQPSSRGSDHFQTEAGEEFASLARILIVDDDPIVCDSIADTLGDHGFQTATALNGPEALEALEDAVREAPDKPARPFRIVVMDINLPGMPGAELLEKIRGKFPEVVIIIVTAYGTIESAVQAIRQGAMEYLTHPLVEEELIIAVGKAARQSEIIADNVSMRRQLDDRFGLDNIIGRDPRMLRIYDLIEAVAPTKTTVLMTGESGTGKSLIARAIHHRSSVNRGPFVEISCGSIPETLLESELFGHVRGAFTGAHADKVGRFLAADHGTIFLDEINSASPGMQLKLLRILQEKRFEPVGSTQTVEVDVRIVLASNQPLEDLVAAGQFRQDLYYRINVVRIELAPLRARVGDIPMLAEHFLRKYGAELKREFLGLDDESLEALRRYRFPGNVRELQNIIERACVLAKNPVIHLSDLPPAVVENRPFGASADTAREGAGRDGCGAGPIWSGESLAQAVEAHERNVILAALNANNWNRNQTADQLGINRTTLYKKIKAYGLDSMNQAG